MRIFTEQALKEFAERNPSSKTALQVWCKVVRKSEWRSLSDIKDTFNSVDYVGNQRFVFTIKGNEYRLVAVVKFSIGFVYIRFIGTHMDYDKIDCKSI
ncbi:MAG: type II toxin-antitoxin system HigB family toxin [Bacteroidales bacterium]|nr:type II toxin-antitoxin system HigB family toxin [Bacteroidales bacterium]